MSKLLETLQKFAEGYKKKLNFDSLISNGNPAPNTTQQEIIKQFQTEQRVSVEIMFRPNKPDLHGHWLSQETIAKGFASAQKAKQEGRLKPNLFHLKDVDNSQLEIVKEYLIQVKCTIGEQEVDEGTWVTEVKWHNESLWKQRTEIVDLPNGSKGTVIAGLSPKFWGVVNDPIEKATTSNVTKDDSGNLVYRGQKFVGYNKPMRSNRDGKQGMVLAKQGDEIKVVHFGDPSMADNLSAEANDAFYARFGNQDGIKDPFSPLYWSASYLWPRGKMKGKGAKDFYTLK